LTLATFARPSPNVFAIAACFGLMQNGGANDPHDCAEQEESNGKHGIVCSSFLSSLVTAFSICYQDADGEDQ